VTDQVLTHTEYFLEMNAMMLQKEICEADHKWINSG